MGILGKFPHFPNPWLGSALAIVPFPQHYRIREECDRAGECELEVTALLAEKE